MSNVTGIPRIGLLVVVVVVVAADPMLINC